MTRPLIVFGGLCLFASAQALAAELDFYRDVFPVLKSNCVSCHNKTTTKGELNMESPEGMRKGGESGAGVIPGKGTESAILQAAAHIGETTMPPKGNKTGAKRLTPTELALLQNWIDQGAKDSVKQVRQIAWEPLPSESAPIYSIAISPDGRFAACARANQLFLYDLACRELATHFAASQRSVIESIAFSADGNSLATGSFREVKLWRPEKTPALSHPAVSDASLCTLSAKELIAVDSQGNLRLLDPATGLLLKSIRGLPAAKPQLLALSPDGLRAAVYSEGSLSLVNLAEGIVLSTASERLLALSWLSDNRSLAAAAASKTIRIWTMPPVESSEVPAPLELKSEAITALCAGPTPDRFIVATEDGKVRLWDFNKPLSELNLPGVLALQLAPDGKSFAAACSDGAIRLWNLDSPKPSAELRGDLNSLLLQSTLEHSVAAQGLEVSFATSEIARIEAQNKALEELLKKANETIVSVKKSLPDKEQAASIAKEAKLLAQKGADQVAELIAKAPEGKPDDALEKQSKEAHEKLMLASVAESAALASVAASENHLKDAQEDVEHITAAKEKNTQAIQQSQSNLSAAKTNQTEGSTKLAAAKNAVTKGGPKPHSIAFGLDGKSIGALFDDGSQRVWAIATGLPLDQLPPNAPEATQMPGTTVARADGSFLSCSSDGAIRSLNLPHRWVLAHTLGSDHPDSPLVDRINALRFSPDGQILAVGGGEPSRSGDLSLWQVASGTLLKSWPDRHADSILSLDFSPDGSLLASGAADKTARITKVSSGKQTAIFEGHTHHVMGVSFRADGRVLASAGADGVVLVWDLLSGERKKKIEGWTKEITSLQFVGATNQILTSAGDNRIRIVSDEGIEIRAITKLPNFMQAAATAAPGSVIVGGGDDSRLRLWDPSNGQELAVFEPK